MIDFELVKTWHKVVVLRVEFALKGIPVASMRVDTVRDHSACELGRWLLGPGKVYSDLADCSVLADKHRQFHETASSVLACCTVDGVGTAEGATLNSLHAASDDVLAAIDKLAAMVGLQPERFGVSDPTGGGNYYATTRHRETLGIGEAALDEQHAALDRLIARLNERPGAMIGSEFFSDIKTALDRLMHTHFQSEEAFMRTIGLPVDLIDAHIKDHTRIVGLLVEIELDTMARKRVTSGEIGLLLAHEMASHVESHDLALRNFARRA